MVVSKCMDFLVWFTFVIALFNNRGLELLYLKGWSISIFNLSWASLVETSLLTLNHLPVSGSTLNHLSVSGSTRVLNCAWNNEQSGSWGLTPPVQLESRHMTYTSQHIYIRLSSVPKIPKKSYFFSVWLKFLKKWKIQREFLKKPYFFT
jgi:hypothetical protein